MITLTGLEMVTVMMRQTLQDAILMVVTVVEQIRTPNIVQNVFAMNKHYTHVLGCTNLKI